MPLDFLDVGSAIGYQFQRQVKVEGEVLYPGMYTIISKDERVSDLLKRAGGLTALAFAKGASLKREAPQKVEGKNAIDQTEEEQNKINKLQRLQEDVKDTTAIELKKEVLKNVYVGIQLDKIIENPGTQTDLILEKGDILRMPKELQTVKVNGEVLYPVTTIFNPRSGFKYYISQGGGFSNKSLKRRSYVIYANGSVESTSKIFFFNKYPSIETGAELFVPKKDESQKLSAQELLGITTGVASLGAIILGILNLSK
jgi:protein involved in polysaccharide export with SLBB domain